MSLVPCYCEDCGARFVSHAVMVDETSTVIFKNTRINCPISPSHHAYLLDGVFTGAGELVKLVSGPDHSVEVLRELTDLLEQARTKGKSIEDAAETADKIYPGLGRILKRFQNLGYAVAFVGVLSAELNVNLNIDIDVNQLVKQATEVWCERLKSGMLQDEDGKHHPD
ncbi:hypothetical protein FF32_15780 [Halomonas campaniensis]|nr:hypothetical protein FF32_15780 [Halomonas campaniensis]